MTEPMANTNISGGAQSGIIGAATVTATQIVINNYSQPLAEQVVVAGPIGLSPYPGLAYFGPDDAGRFFGRDDAIAKLTAAVGRQTLTAVVGASGSGKSSVVLAGLAPSLHQSGGWLFSYFRIGDEIDRDPFLALSRALVPLYVTSADETERLKNIKSLASDLSADRLSLRDVFADCRKRYKASRILLIADQFEEAFTLIQDEAVADRFVEVLLRGFPDAPPDGRPDICLVLTMRADFYGHALKRRNLADALQDHVENLGPMNREELRLAIIRPAELAGVSFEPGLVETLLDRVEGKPASLPLLQFALREMWGRQENGQITRKSYDEIKGVEGALAERAEKIFKEMTESDERMARAFQRLFTRSVTLGEGQEDTRRVVDRRELGDEAWSLAQRLAGEDNRLIVTNAPPTSARETAEVIHEALIRNWPRLVDWIRRDRALHAWTRRISSNIELWSADPADDGPLLRGGQLAQAVDWLASRHDDLSEREIAFVEASSARQRREESEAEAVRQAELRRQQDLARSRLRQRWAAFAAAFVLFIIAGVAIWQRGLALSAEADAVAQRERAQEQTEVALQQAQLAQRQTKLGFSRELAAESLGHLDDSLDLSLLLALEALNSADTFEARNALFTAITHYPRIERYLRGQIYQLPQGALSTRSSGLAFRPDGGMLAAVGYNEGGVTLYDPRAGGVIRRLGGNLGFASALAFSHDSKLLVAGGDDKALRIWDPSTGALLQTSAALEDYGTAIAFGANSDVVYFGFNEKLTRWRWRDGERTESIATPSLRFIKRMYLSAGDKYAVISGYSSSDKQPNDEFTVWIDLQTGRAVGDPLPGAAIAISNDGNQVAIAQTSGVQVYDVESRRATGASLKSDTFVELMGGAFSPDATRLAISLDSKIVLWDLKTGKAVDEPWSGHVETIDALAFEPDGTHLTSLGADDSIIQWRVAAPRSLAHVFAKADGDWGLGFSPTTTIIASVGDKTTTLRDTSSGKTVAVLQTPEFPEGDPQFSPDGRLLLMSAAVDTYEDKKAPRAAAVYDVQSRRRVLSLPDGGRGGPLAIAPDGGSIALTDDLDNVVLWSVSAQTFSSAIVTMPAAIEAMTFVGADGLAVGDERRNMVNCFRSVPKWRCDDLESDTQAPLALHALPAHGELIGTGHESVVLWDLHSRRRIHELVGQTTIGSPAIATVAPDQQMVAWGTFTRHTIEILDSRLSRAFGEKLEVSSKSDSLEGTNGLAFRPDGKALASTNDGFVYLWDFDVASWRRIACFIANRNLTSADWARYFPGEQSRETCAATR